MYKNTCAVLLNLPKNNPASEEPIMFTNAVDIGRPRKVMLEIVNKYLRLEPITAPVKSAIYEDIFENYLTN